jgi:hypothetical protein
VVTVLVTVSDSLPSVADVNAGSELGLRLLSFLVLQVVRVGDGAVAFASLSVRCTCGCVFLCWERRVHQKG